MPSPASTPVPCRRPIPRAGVRQGLVNRIRGLLAWSSHPNPAGRGKVRLGQKAAASRVWPWPADPCAGSGDGAAATDPRCHHAGGHSHHRVPSCAAASGPPACRTPGTGASRWHGSAGRQRDEPIQRLGAAAVRQSSCFSVKSPAPCLEKKKKNKREWSRCLALCGVAARAWPWFAVENTNAGAGPVRTHSPTKAPKTAPPH